MEKFNPFQLLTEQIQTRAAEGESTFEATTHAPPRATPVESVDSFEWKPGLIRFKHSFILFYFYSRCCHHYA